MAGLGKSIVGKIRKTNEDSILVCNDAIGALPNLYVVADGMGGHLAGEIASGMAVSGMREFLLENTGQDNMFDALSDAIQSANRNIYLQGLSDDKLRGMGTTVLAATISDKTAYIVNVGDSRLYIVNPVKNTIEQITEDHSYVMELLRQGKITEEEAERHPKKNIITRALGIGECVECDCFSYELKDSDILLMCSDGLTNMLLNNDILRIFKEKTGMAETLEGLLEGANEKGGLDNISVILYCEDDGV